MEKAVLDTNLFFNMQSGLGLGSTTHDIVVGLTEKLRKLKEAKKVEILMPPKIVEEFLGFFEDQKQPFITQFLSVITAKSPDTRSQTISAEVLVQFVEDVRQRNYNGLRAGEEELRNAGRRLMGVPPSSTKEIQIAEGEGIKKFRQRFRQATRVGFLDSVADLELILLSKEQDAHLISSDEGVIYWGRALGVKEMRPEALVPWLDQRLRQE